MTLEELIKDEQLKAHAQKAPLQKSEIDEQIKKLAERHLNLPKEIGFSC
jgi:hypothetical protein